MKGSYYFINGLASCRLGERIMHPFEAHGFIKSLTFDGSGSMAFKSNLIETRLARKESAQNKPLARGVMSTVADYTMLLWCIQNALRSRSHTTRFMVFHDWVITENYYVVPQNPARLKCPQLFSFLVGQTADTDIFEMEHEANGAFLLIPRHDANLAVRTVESDRFFNIFHFGSTFETLDADAVMMYGLVFDHYTFGGEMGFDGPTLQFDPIAWGDVGGKAPPPRLDQFVIRKEDSMTTTRIAVTDPATGDDAPVDIPAFHGDMGIRYSYFWGPLVQKDGFRFGRLSRCKTTLNWDALVCTRQLVSGL